MAFNDVTLFETDVDQTAYAITVQISHDPIDEGELSLLFKSDGTPLYTVSFTIVPGYTVGLAGRHALLLSRMQGSRAKFQEIRRATKEMGDISPQALLVAALEGIAIAMRVPHIAGVCAANLAAHNERTEEILVRHYDGFYKTIGGESKNSGFYLMDVPFPKKSLALVKPGHRLRTKLKQKIKTDLAEAVCAAWRKIIPANDGDGVPAPGKDAQMPIAEAWFRAGARANELRLHFSASPIDGRDWPRTEFLAKTLRARFPDADAGYRIGTTALRELCRFDEALAVAAEGMARFPNEAWPVAEAAWVARALGDTGEAVRLAAELRHRSPGDPAGYQIGANALCETHRFDEAAAVAAEAMARFPAEAWPLAAAAWTARVRGQADRAVRLAAELRFRFPDDPTGYQVGAAELREQHRFDEASEIAAEGIARFPSEAWPVAEAAWIAKERGDADQAIRLAADLRLRFPDHPAGHQIAPSAPGVVEIGA
jgi:tetratricopeptide (TPR) repeat protein